LNGKAPLLIVVAFNRTTFRSVEIAATKVVTFLRRAAPTLDQQKRVPVAAREAGSLS